MTDDDILTPKDGSLNMHVLAHLLKAYKNESADLLEVFARLLESAIPDKVRVTRGGWFFAKEKPVEKLEIHLKDAGFTITKSRNGELHVEQRKIVRGITLSSKPAKMEACIQEVMTHLDEITTSSETTRDALEKFIRSR
jgi:hypothetical protein